MRDFYIFDCVASMPDIDSIAPAALAATAMRKMREARRSPVETGFVSRAEFTVHFDGDRRRSFLPRIMPDLSETALRAWEEFVSEK